MTAERPTTEPHPPEHTPANDWYEWTKNALLDAGFGIGMTPFGRDAKVENLTRAIAQGAAPLDLLREVAASGVVHEAEPPGIDYVTVQVDMDTWARLRAWSEGAAHRAAGRAVQDDGLPTRDELREGLEHVLDVWTAPSPEEFARLHRLMTGHDSCAAPPLHDPTGDER